MANDNNQLALIITEQDKVLVKLYIWFLTQNRVFNPNRYCDWGSLFRQSRMAVTLWHEVMSSMQRLSCVVFLLSLERVRKISIFGPGLDMDTDFKVWLGSWTHSPTHFLSLMGLLGSILLILLSVVGLLQNELIQG